MISRPSPDVAYVVAHGHRTSLAQADTDTSIGFDNLRYGAETTTLTDAQGAYSFVGLPPGAYQVQAIRPYGGAALAATQLVTLAAAIAGQPVQPVGGVDFASPSAVVSWRNPANPTDVNEDGAVTAIDALTVINYINSHPGNAILPTVPPTPPPYCDVSGDGVISALDVLQVIDAINRSRIGGAAAVAVAAPSGAAAISGGQGESPPVTGRLAQTPTAIAEKPTNPALPNRWSAGVDAYFTTVFGESGETRQLRPRRLQFLRAPGQAKLNALPSQLADLWQADGE